MPIADVTTAALFDLDDAHFWTRTTAAPAEDAAACYVWALMSLRDDAVSPDAVFQYIVGATTRPQLADYLAPRLPAPRCAEVLDLCDVYRQEFEPFSISHEPPVAASVAFGQRQAMIEAISPSVFELLLECNGFTLSRAPTDYLVCMHFESDGVGIQGPNFTHMWLRYFDVAIQTIPGVPLVVAKHEVQHGGYVVCRRYVTDFTATQNARIDALVADRNAQALAVRGARAVAGGIVLASAPAAWPIRNLDGP
ncbi:MAG: hypothetical protein R3B06_12410 [Kofleriaceae bacterium]